jgi:hypothetical protein
MNWAILVEVTIHVCCISGSHPRRLAYFKLLFYVMQSLSMFFQNTLQSETLTTITVERFLTSVQSIVSLQTDLPSECLPTDWTHKTLFTRLYHKMLHKVTSESERLLIFGICVCFVSSVNTDIKVKCILSDKTFVIHWMLLWTIIKMVDGLCLTAILGLVVRILTWVYQKVPRLDL